MLSSRLVSSSSSLRFFVRGNSLGKAKNQRLQNALKPPNMAKPSHQFPTQRVSSGVSDVWTPNSTNFERKTGLKTNPAAAPEKIFNRSIHHYFQELWLSCLSVIYVKWKEKNVRKGLKLVSYSFWPWNTKSETKMTVSDLYPLVGDKLR